MRNHYSDQVQKKRKRDSENGLAGPVRANPISSARQRLLKLLFKLNFGRVEQLPIVNGQPLLDAEGVRIIQDHKLPRDPEPRSNKIPDSHWDKAQVVDFCELLDQDPDVTILLLEVRHGTPFRVLTVGQPS
jgi:hypothetical protein